MSQETNNAPTGQGPVDRPVRPRAWMAQAPNGNIRVWTSAAEEAVRLARDTGYDLEAMYAMPQDLADYLMRHLRHERAALDGFVAFGNEVARAQRLDGWIAALEGPNTAISGPRSGSAA